MNKLPENISQENPIVCYIIVNESLNMGVGKLAAQVGHAVQLLMFEYEDLDDEAQSSVNSALNMTQDRVNMYLRIQTWLNQEINSKFRKIVLGADAKEWEKLKLDQPEHILVKDAGLTEIAPGSETVILLYPMLKSERSKLLKRLRCL